ncbi:PrsW family intramembrane metalloprotease [Haladaptatus sp. YSMS36]|uniref:PrsW family intramembrane metalloprotease n=1 Tax=Haladaptatus sp. YSMS36 TaxID=3033384 RepID=UPI0023E8002A|nr:PrsW family intramembrane metalloprotease [Haladaptatus sp. YSMS36]
MNPRKLLRIARWEVTKGAGGIDRRTAIAGVVAIVLLVVVSMAAVSHGVTLDRGIYRVGVDESSPYYGPVAADPTFAIHDPTSDEEFDLLIQDGRVGYRDTQKGRAALAELRRAVEGYNDRLMATEGNRSAAFPVAVNITYVNRAGGEVVVPGSGGQGQQTADEPTQNQQSPGGATETPAAGGGGGDGGNTPLPGDQPPLADGLLGGGSGDTPSDIAPPFPFESLALAFLFVLPMNFVIQAYGSSILKERVNRRGVLLLVSPVSRYDIVAGKTLPYFLASLAITTVIALAIGGGPISITAVIPLALVFLAATFLAGMFARSFKELTFVTVAISVFLTTYAFVPAIFTDLNAIALISPLTLVVRDLQSQAITAGEYAFATLPLYLTAFVLFTLGVGIYREEDMFTQRPVHLKALDAISSRISGRRSIAVLSILFIPFVFVAELLAVATLFALPVSFSIPVLLVAIALVEEIAKSIHVFAGFESAKFDRRLKLSLILGTLSGVGFFLAEKLTLVSQIVGLPELRLGNVAFAGGVETSGLVLLGFLLAPLVLHVVTATISAIGAARGARSYAVALGVAIFVHTVYNLTVVMQLG